MQYVIKTAPQQTINPTVLGTGNTEEEAWVNAFGPKPWFPTREAYLKIICWCEKIEPKVL